MKPEASLPPGNPPAGVLEYRAAASVALVSLREVPQPPCIWIRFRRSVEALFQAKASFSYPHDTCGSAGRSQRYEMAVIETFKGSPPARFPAVLDGYYPVNNRWMSKHRPDWMRFTTTRSDVYWSPGRALVSHGAFPFLHAGALSDLNYVVQEGICGNDYTLPVVGLAPDHLVFRNASGVVTHWEPVDRGKPDGLLDHMRQMRAGKPVTRPTITSAAFFSGFDTVAVYDVSGCRGDEKVSAAGNQRIEPLDHAVLMAFLHSRHSRKPASLACSGRRRFLVLTSGYSNKRAYPERTWPIVQLVPVVNGSVRTADIETQFNVTGPERIAVSQILAWTAASTPPWYDQ